MALLLDIWYAHELYFSATCLTHLKFPRTSLILGILYLSFQAFPVIFEEGHGFNMQTTGLSFLGIGLGMVIAWASQPYWNRLVYSLASQLQKLMLQARVFARENAKHGGNAPPEVRLIMGQLGGILIPIGETLRLTSHSRR